MSIIINKKLKILSLFSNNLKESNEKIVLNDSFLENKLISSLYLIELFLKDKEIKLIQIKNDFIEIDFKSVDNLKLKFLKKISLIKEISKIKLNKKYDKKISFNFFESSKKLENYKIEILDKKFDSNFLKELFLQNLSTYEVDNEIINRLQIKISNTNTLLDTDHRKINKTLNFFCFNPLNGAALPIWLPNGELVKNLIKNYIRELEEKNKFIFVTTPVLVNKKLFEISGHFQHYKDSMFPEIGDGLNSLVLRPMTCPQHCLIFKNIKRSYKELPLRISENALLFRYESSGSLTGLERVRQMELKDLHIFIANDDVIIKNEIKRLYKMTIKMLTALGIKINEIYLSLHDVKEEGKYFVDSQLWNKTEKLLANILKEMKVNFISMKGEAAFYGPKIDFQIKSILGHDITVSTIQLDFLLPKKFDLKYRTDSQKSNLKTETPIILHHGIFGTYERMISILLEQNNGWLPFWISPKQVAISPITNNVDIVKYCEKIKKILEKYKIRTKLFNFENNLNSNVKKMWIQKIPYQIFIGENELKNQKITIINYKNPKDKIKLDIFEFIEKCNMEIINKK